jgi:transcriptional regulator with XRE-family HTH domain
MDKDKHRKLTARRLKRLLEDAEISQTQIAAEAKVCKQYVSAVIHGDRKSYDRVRPVIARHLGFDPWVADKQSNEHAA